MKDKIINLLYLLDHRTRRLTPLMILSGVILSFLEIMGLGLIFPLVLLLLEDANEPANPLLQNIFRIFPLKSSEEIAVILAIIIFALIILKNLGSIFVFHWQNKTLARFETSLASSLFSAHLHAPYSYIRNRNSSELIRNVYSLSKQIVALILLPATAFIVEFVTLVLALCILIVTDPLSSGIAFSILGGGGLCLYLLLHKRVGLLGKIVQDENVNQLTWIRQGYGAIKELHIFDRQDYVINVVDQHTRKLSKLYAEQRLYQAFPRYILEILIAVTLGSIVLTLSSHRSSGEVIATLALLGAASLRIASSTNRILVSAQQLRIGSAAIDCLSEEVALKEAIPSSRSPATAEKYSYDEKLNLNSVCYSHPDQAKGQLRDINFSITKGESVAIVGASGAGKSTLIDLLLGFHQPQTGEILCDQSNIFTNLSEWRKIVGYVPQKIYLIDSSIRQNIALGLPESEINEAAVHKVIYQAGLEDFLASLPEGLNTIVGEEGARLSGGQAQRIGVARALYAQPKLLIFDEATSALDANTEKFIINELLAHNQARTLIFVTHRLGAVRNFDKIVFMGDGKILDIGSFSELINRNSEFQRLASDGGVTSLSR
ncbi:ABC transporter ATP-binding protein [Kiloniella laminariae]|uniref:ABC transporter ATP-binding protein n=1 Tax=Kiloniella laminariae TaxID=454162 RepID=UPI000362F0FF|nr:ABC transporter ATP-binding protein [Kiloniella laminariae]